MELEKIDMEGVYDTFAISAVQKEFRKAVNEPWKKEPPWQRYQKKLIGDLAVLCEYKEQAIDLPQFERLVGEEDLYSISHPETTKNVRILYIITEDSMVILLTAFLEKNASDYRRAIRRAKERIKWLYGAN